MKIFYLASFVFVSGFGWEKMFFDLFTRAVKILVTGVIEVLLEWIFSSVITLDALSKRLIVPGWLLSFRILDKKMLTF